jgi:hypothetical protein
MALVVAGNDLTTQWSLHLKKIGVPKNEREVALLLLNAVKAGGNDLTTLLKPLLEGKV